MDAIVHIGAVLFIFSWVWMFVKAYRWLCEKAILQAYQSEFRWLSPDEYELHLNEFDDRYPRLEHKAYWIYKQALEAVPVNLSDKFEPCTI
jgi:hypothetical protein